MLVLTNRTKNIIKLILLVATFALPLILAHYMYYHGNIKGGTTNKGTLIPNPHHISELHLNRPALVNTDEWQDKSWHILYRIPDVCDNQCLEVLHRLQQVHIALGKNKDRIQRVNIHNNSLSNNIQVWQNLYNMYPHMTVTNTSEFELTKAGNSIIKQDYIYIADPLGNIILSYEIKNSKFDDNIFKDTQKLLKASNIG